MTLWQLALIVGLLIIAGISVAIFILKPSKNLISNNNTLTDLAEKDVEQIFNDEFREELRNRGRLHFEKIIAENAMFLQQDLRLTTSQLNDYMKDEIKRVLQEEFSKYEKSISDARDLALNTIKKTQELIEQQRTILEKQMKEETAKEKTRLIEHFEQNMTEIVNHYILEAIGNEIDLTTQLDYIFHNLEENKEALIEDIKSGT